MLLHIEKAVDSETLKALQDLGADERAFEDGRTTAGWSARHVKSNLQLARPGAKRQVTQMVEAALRKSPIFMAAAQPKAFCKIMINRFDPGMQYGTHIDDPLIAGQRTDLSFTLFLSPPEAYDGGELILESPEGETEIKLEAGALILYPTTVLHRVAEVTRGTRLACVGWIRSLIRLDAQREILFDLDRSARSVFKKEGKSELFDQLSKTKANLIRLWAED